MQAPDMLTDCELLASEIDANVMEELTSLPQEQPGVGVEDCLYLQKLRRVPILWRLSFATAAALGVDEFVLEEVMEMCLPSSRA
jgi:hypothetical protein